MIYLIGVDHKAQASSSGSPETESQKQFAESLQKVIAEANPVCVAEEYNEEAEKENGVISIAKMLVNDPRKHRFCDPTKSERQQIGYLGPQELHLLVSMHDKNWDISNEEAQAKGWAICLGKYFIKREQFWLDKIRDVASKEAVVFVCGNAHIESFTDLLTAEGVSTKVVGRGIGITAEDEADWKRGVDYLRAHPKCVEEGF